MKYTRFDNSNKIGVSLDFVKDLMGKFRETEIRIVNLILLCFKFNNFYFYAV